MFQFHAYAYTDGSYQKETQNFTYGLVLFNFKTKTKLYSNGKFNDPNWAKMHNIAGEIMGIVKAIQMCENYHLTSLLIFHDYQGLAKWVNGEWQAKNPLTQAYKKYVNEKQKTIKIFFKWVKAHNGDKYNEKADQLANEAYNNIEIIKPLL